MGPPCLTPFGEVVCLNLDRIFLTTINFAGILEISQDFFLFRINRYCWLLFFLKGQDSLGNEFELGIPIGMLLAFDGFAICLKAISRFLQKLANLYTANLESLPLQFNRKRFGTLACPSQR